MTPENRSAAVFAEHRGHLVQVGYRMLGTVADAEDAVQEAWLRFARVDLDTLDDPRAWLTTVVSRLCLDHLRSARVRREQYVGPWLPEPLVTSLTPRGLGPAMPADPADPADRVTLDESVSMAMLVVLETLSPAERTAFVLHDVFGMAFGEVSEAVGRTPVACRQLASRARRHVRARSPHVTSEPDEHARVVTAFSHAVESGDLEQLLAVLDPEVVWRADGGGVVPSARKEVVGAERVARLVLGLRRNRTLHEMRPALVNGALGYVSSDGSRVRAVFAFTVVDGRIAETNVVTNPGKLGRVTTSSAS